VTKHEFLAVALIFVWRAFYLIAARDSTLMTLGIKWRPIMDNIPKNSTARVFFALWPNDAERSALAAWQAVLKPTCGGRVMRADTLHLTLVFLGNVPCARLEALQLAAQEVSAPGFDLLIDEARYWQHNHILYTAPGVVPRQLAYLVSALEKSLLHHQFEFEQRDYQPHLTLLRNARCGVASLAALPPVSWQIRDFVLLQSAPQNGVAAYQVLARFPLQEFGKP